MRDLPREDEPFERSKVQTSEALGESLNFLHCCVWHPNKMIQENRKTGPKSSNVKRLEEARLHESLTSFYIVMSGTPMR
jgi:hypothetical protein